MTYRVTQVVAVAFPVDTSHFTQYHRDRGTAMHRATELFDRGTLDEGSVDPAIEGRLAAYRRFCRDTEASILTIEEEVVHATLGYAGRLDRRMMLPWFCRAGLRGGPIGMVAASASLDAQGRHEAIVDIKGPFCSPDEGVQTAGYAGTFDRPLDRYALRLYDDGRYILEPLRDRRDWPVFKACLEILNYRAAHSR